MAYDHDGRVLIIVDFQKGFVNEHTAWLKAPIEAFQKQFTHIVATRFFRRSGSKMAELLGIDGFERGGSDTELAFSTEPQTHVIEKSTYSCVTPKFVDLLRSWGAGEVYVCGVDTDQCVLMIAADLLQADFAPVVCADITASAAGSDYLRSALFIIERLIGRQQVRKVSS
jgi:nicotinamidase-related amidase